MTLTVALVGVDGAGKTSVATRLTASPSLRCRYLYMGPSVTSGNALLPTSRIARLLKERRSAPSDGRTAGGRRGGGIAASGSRRRKRLRIAASLANHLAEATWRQLLANLYQRRGFTVIYDRHFLFESVGGGRGSEPAARSFDRLEHWLLSRALPRPDLVVFLDAPFDVVRARKGEGTASRVEKRRATILELGARMPWFVEVDASRPLDLVVDEVTRLILSRDGVGASVGPETRAGSASERDPG